MEIAANASSPLGEIVDNEYTFYFTSTATEQRTDQAPRSAESPLKPLLETSV